jgi:hypothetical protein
MFNNYHLFIGGMIMKKLLLSTAAIAGMAMIANPAAAQVKLELGGYFKGYGAYVDQDEPSTTASGDEVNGFDIIRDTEVHFGGETTLDNGLTVGAHIEAQADGGDAFGVDESYVYFAGGWGRVNFGAEDGAGYLLQVAAPSADSNIDGIRQYVQPVNYTVLALASGASPAAGTVTAGGIDYDMDQSAKSDKFTYLSPIMNGFQAGVSFSPDTDAAASLAGIGTDEVEDGTGATYEGAVRYEGQFNNVGVILGAGYAHSENERETTIPAVSQDRKAWNVGADFDIGPFGVGVAYREDDGGTNSSATVDEEETLVIGVDYTTGPFVLGASYYDQNNTFTVKNDDLQRYSGGVTYTYGPGMTFRGSIGHIQHEDSTAANPDADATYVTLGTQINF